MCIHIETGQVYCGKENQDAEIYFCINSAVLAAGAEVFPFSFVFFIGPVYFTLILDRFV